MPTFDIAAEKWNAWFKEIPTWPTFLTKTYWDKNKSVLAKMTLATGVGEQLKTCETSFKAAALKMPFMGGARQVDIDNSVKECSAFITSSPVKTLHAELKALRDAAKIAAVECKKNKLIPRATTQLCTDITTAADTMMVCCNPNSLSGCVSDALRKHTEGNAEKQRKMADPVVRLCKGVPAKVLGLIAKMRLVLNAVPIEKARSAIGSQLFTSARDMTQPLGNLIKCANAGVNFANFDLDEAKRLAQALVPYGDGKAAKCDDASKEEIETKLQAVEQAATDMKDLVATIAVQG